MILIDSLLSAPVRGLLFVLEKIDEAVKQEIDAEDQAIMMDLTSLHRLLDEGAIAEGEFDAREQELLRRLDRLRSGGVTP